MMNFRENEEAVSPVIGVILMVAITVILAAVIAAFVFGMGSNVGTTKTVAVTVNQNGDDIILTYHGGADASTLKFLMIRVDPGDATKGKETYYTVDESGSLSTTKTGLSTTLEVGAVMTIEQKGTDQRDHVVVTGHFADGSDHVVLDTFV
jgi:flagellin-like protein